MVIILELVCLPRNILLSNGSFAVTFDSKAQIRDFYFPYFGLENHAVGHHFRFGVWVDGKFEWIDGDWDFVMTYMPETLAGRHKITQAQTGVEIEINDAIHHNQDIFLRKAKIVNQRDYPLQIRLFFTHDFHINGYEAGYTAFFDPQQRAIIHYKGKGYFLVGGDNGEGGFNQYAVGVFL